VTITLASTASGNLALQLLNPVEALQDGRAGSITTSDGQLAVARVAVNVSPGLVALTSSQSQQFNASVTGSSNTAVIWSMTPSAGTLSSSGLYTAPSAITSSQTITITATSAADSTRSASATVTLMPPVTVFVGPANVSLSASQSQIGRASC